MHIDTGQVITAISRLQAFRSG